MGEEQEEELQNKISEPSISSKESTMTGEGAGEVHHVNDEQHRIGGGRRCIRVEEEEDEVVEEIHNLLDSPSLMRIPQPQ